MSLSLRLRRGSAESPPRRSTRTRRALRFIWRWGLRPALVLALLLLIIVGGGRAWQAARAATMTPAERLTEDLDRLERILVRQHPAPFGNATRGQVEAAIERARGAIASHAAGEVSEELVLAHFVQAVASLRDPHTSVAGRYDRFGILPVSFRLFDEEVRVLAAPDSSRLGGRVIAFDGLPAAEVLDRARALVPYANDTGFADLVVDVLRMPGLLHAIGAAAEPDGVVLEVETELGPRDLSLSRLTMEEYRAESLPTITLDEQRLPRHRRRALRAFGYEALPQAGALYLRYAWAASGETPLEALADSALRLRDSLALGPIIVDLRGNPGGDPRAHIPLVAALAAAPSTRGPGNVRVLVDRGVYSAAVVAAGDLERRVGALLVGEEPGDRAHLTTDARPFTLRHSGLEVWVPTGLMHTPGGAGGRHRLTPVRGVRPTFEEWRAGLDPVLEAALSPPAPRLSEAGAAELASELREGRFAFDVQRALTLASEGATYRAEVTGLGTDRLTPSGTGVWSGGIHLGLRMRTDGSLERRLPDGAWAEMPVLEGEAPLELLLSRGEDAASSVYERITSGGADRRAVADLGLVSEGTYLYQAGQPELGRRLFRLAERLSPTDALIPLQHSLLRQEAEGSLTPRVRYLLRALVACARRYRQVELQNDLWLCL